MGEAVRLAGSLHSTLQADSCAASDVSQKPVSRPVTAYEKMGAWRQCGAAPLPERTSTGIMTHAERLFEPLQLGALELPNRILMAALTRNRAQSNGIPDRMAETYYYQRAAAGLIITEATQISAMGKGYVDTPGIYTDAHVEAWARIVDAVHAGGGRVFCQLWHVGRISHVSLLPKGKRPVSSSAVQADAQTFTVNGFEACSKPEALTEEGIAQIIHRLAKRYGGTYIANGGYTKERAGSALSSGHAAAIAFGRLFLANPDLPERLRRNAELNEPQQETFYGGGAAGYIDYPFLGVTHRLPSNE